MSSRIARTHAFTLVEILIVVVILGILAAIAVPRFVGATEEAKAAATASELQKLRRHIGVYQARHNTLPEITESNGDWGQLVGPNYLNTSPTNSWVGGDNGRKIVYGTGPDAEFTYAYGWIFDDVTGDVWAAGFDADDRPLARP